MQRAAFLSERRPRRAALRHYVPCSGETRPAGSPEKGARGSATAGYGSTQLSPVSIQCRQPCDAQMKCCARSCNLMFHRKLRIIRHRRGVPLASGL